MKYSTVKNDAFGEAHEALGGKRKSLKAEATRWLSHGEVSKRLIAQFSCLIDALETILEKGADQEVKGFRDELLKPDTIYFCCCSQIFWHISTGFHYFCKEKI